MLLPILDPIRRHIRQIGEEILLSYPRYPEVALDRQNGILPRDLIFDENGRDGKVRGCVVVGLNPGFSNGPERQYYRENGCSYESVVDYFHRRVRYEQYYSLLRDFVDALGLIGPILWTEIVKCEKLNEDIRLSDETIRDSARRYLPRELAVIPTEWPVIAVGVGKPFQVLVGGKPFQVFANKFYNRHIIGIPHATSSHGQFAHLFPERKIEPAAKLYLDKLLATTAPYAKAYRCPKNSDCRFQ